MPRVRMHIPGKFNFHIAAKASRPAPGVRGFYAPGVFPLPVPAQGPYLGPGASGKPMRAAAPHPMHGMGATAMRRGVAAMYQRQSTPSLRGLGARTLPALASHLASMRRGRGFPSFARGMRGLAGLGQDATAFGFPSDPATSSDLIDTSSIGPFYAPPPVTPSDAGTPTVLDLSSIPGYTPPGSFQTLPGGPTSLVPPAPYTPPPAGASSPTALQLAPGLLTATGQVVSALNAPAPTGVAQTPAQIAALNAYNQALSNWEANPVGPAPVPPSGVGLPSTSFLSGSTTIGGTTIQNSTLVYGGAALFGGLILISALKGKKRR